MSKQNITDEQKQMIEEFRKLPGYDVNALLRTNVEEFLIKWSDTLLQKEREAGKREGIELTDEEYMLFEHMQRAWLAQTSKETHSGWFELRNSLNSKMSKLKSQSVEKEEWQSELGKVELPERRKLISEFDKKKSEGTGGKE